MGSANKETMAGQEVRFMDIPIESPSGLGAFDTIQEFEDGGDFAKEITEKTRMYYGTAAHEFLTQFSANRDEYIAKIKQYKKQFVGQIGIEKSDPQVHRVADQFALVYAGGVVATEMGITGWPEGEVLRATTNCFGRWLNERGGDESYEERNMLEELKNTIHNNLTTRFYTSSVEGEASYANQLIREPWGFIENGFIYFFQRSFTQVFKNSTKLKKLLVSEGYTPLTAGGKPVDRKRFKRIASTNNSNAVVVINLNILDDEAPSDQAETDPKDDKKTGDKE